MFGFALGTMCLLGFAALGGGHPHHHGCHHGRAHPHHHPRRREGLGRAAGEVLKRKLRIDEDQEGIVDHALADIRAAVREAADELRDTRAGILDAFRGETVDDASLTAAFARHDEAIGRARREITSALKQIHAVLDPDQRARVGELLGHDLPRWV